MSDKGEKTCPLCAEEMDLTDQQLKPCKCGYDICVWCWHHIMDMAEKDGNEGRCPACRVPYDKEKIVGTAANCGRVVAEINTERKVKSQKTKAKPSEGRKQLSSVRVVQRNLVYVVGLPLHLGDEDLLQHKEYFGRYGKVLKVSMSRTTTGAIQQFPNNTCSVYITYSKEEEAASCIQAVHGFTLEGRPLRACFGTTKYCHAWLRNMARPSECIHHISDYYEMHCSLNFFCFHCQPCGNPDCLYLHEVGSQEDSFTKDEIVPAHTRVQEITGATTNLLCRSGNVLPPPLDENASNCTALPGKPGVSNASNLYPSLPSAANPVKGSPPNSSSGRPAILPSGASWGMRGSSSQPSMASAVACDALGKQKVNTTSVPLAFSSAVASTMPTSALRGEFRKKLTLSEENQFSKLDSSRKKQDGSDLTKSSVEQNLINVHRPATKDQFVITSSMLTRKMEDVSLKETYSPAPEKSAWDDDSTDDNLYISNKNNSNGHLSASDATYVRYSADNVSNVLPEEVEKPPSSVEDIRENETSEGCKQLTSSESTAVEEQCDRTSTMPSQVPSTTYSDVDEDVRSFNIQRLQDSQVVTRPSHLLNLPAAPRVSNYAREPLIHMADSFGSITMNVNPLIAGISAHEGSQLHASRTPVISNGYNVNMAGENGFLFPKVEENQMKRFESHVDNGLFNATDSRENSIISDILSIDLEFDGSLAARNLARLFSDVGKQPGSRLLPTSWSAQNHSSNQSRFSFARQDESSFQSSSESSNPNFRHPSFSNNIIESRNQYLDKVGHSSSSSFNNFEDHNTAGRNQVAIASTKISAPRGPPVSAPPGFSLPSRTTPPPGFTSFERADQTFNSQPGSHSLNHSLFRSSPPTGNMFINSDIEFLDPAILAVGTGRLPVGGNNGSLDVRSHYPSEFNAFENEARSKLLMQRSLTPQKSTQNGFSYLSDNYSLCPQHLEQSQDNNYSPFTQISHQQQQQPRNGFLSNGLHHDGWRDTDSQHANSNLTLTDLIMNERLGGFNKRYNGFEDASAFRMPTSADLYNRSFGM